MNIQRDISERGYAEMPLGVSDADFEQSFEAFDNFISVSLDDRTAGNYSLGTSNGNFGYFRRHSGSNDNGRSEATETKHEYHFGSETRQHFEAHTEGMRNLPSEVRTFCDTAEEIYWLTILCLKQSFLQMSTEGDGLDRNGLLLTPDFIKADRRLNLHLRFIAYEKPKSEKDDIAKGHFDRSVFTLALAETEPGLEIGLREDGSDLAPVEHKDGQAKLFAGKGWEKMPQHVQNNYEGIRPAYHLVKNHESLMRISGPIVRRAVVFFANPLDIETDPAPHETRPSRPQHELIQAA